MLRQQIESGSIVAELDPETLEPSFISDRLAPIDDPQYRQLVELIRKDGQALPILVRPHPDQTGIYQIAYGHRRWHAARELAVKVRAIIQTLTDAEFVIAQGKKTPSGGIYPSSNERCSPQIWTLADLIVRRSTPR